MKKAIIIFLSLFATVTCFSQAYYFVQFTDKGNPCAYSTKRPSEFLSERAINRRTTHTIAIDTSDFPVHKNYIQSITNLGLTLKHSSRWLNGATFLASDTTVMAQVRALPFVKYSQQTKLLNNTKSTIIKTVNKITENYGAAATQIQMLRLDSLHTLGFTGNNMHIAVIDAGFYKVNENPAFEQFRSNGQLLGTKDFVDENSDIYAEDRHGMYVLSTIVGCLSERYLGSAPNASCWLLRTEEDSTESLLEIDNWVAAVEFADSAGVDAITSSLGYSQFDDTSTNFTYQDLNGKTARNSIVATIAAQKGILVLNSAGNEGNSSWHYITMPSDADNILTVGSVDAARQKSSFSSFGPTSDGRIKPEVCAMGSLAALINYEGEPFYGNGTSFSTPIMAGAALCLWQALPKLNNIELIKLICQHASQAKNPDNNIGYGIPDMVAAYYAPSTQNSQTKITQLSIYPNPVQQSVTIILPDNNFYHVEITDISGRTMWQTKQISHQCVINCANWSQGIYCIRVQNQNNTYLEKLIKQ